MEDQYYRKPQPKLGGWFKKYLRKRGVILFLLIALPALSFMMFSNKGIFQRYSLESDKKEIQLKIQEAHQEQLKLQQQSKSLDSDPKAIEKVAREKYGMIKAGETVYKVKKETK